MQQRGESSETYQNCGKLSLSCSTDNQYSSSMSRSLSRRFLPSLWGVVLRVIAGRVDLCLVDRSETVTAFLTSVVEVFADPWPDFLRWWCMRQECKCKEATGWSCMLMGTSHTARWLALSHHKGSVPGRGEGSGVQYLGTASGSLLCPRQDPNLVRDVGWLAGWVAASRQARDEAIQGG